MSILTAMLDLDKLYEDVKTPSLKAEDNIDSPKDLYIYTDKMFKERGLDKDTEIKKAWELHNAKVKADKAAALAAVEYTSQDAGSDADRDAAAKAFKKELTNGPEKMVWYGSQQFPQKVGALDLDNLHKAFDKWYEDNNLLHIFNKDGLLKNSATYGEFKNLDKKEPAVNALLKLWGQQFKGERELLTDKVARETKEAEEEKKRQAELAAREQKQQERKAALVTTLKAIESSDEFKNLVAAYPAEEQEKIKIDSYVHANAVEITIDNVIAGPNKNRAEIRLFDSDYNSLQDLTDDLTKKAIETCAKLTSTAQAAFFLIKNYETFLSRPEGQIPEIVNAIKLNWICYVDAANKKYYKTKVLLFNNKPGLMLINLTDEKDRGHLLTESCMLVALRAKDIDNSRMMYEYVVKDTYYNQSAAPVFDKLDITGYNVPAKGFCTPDTEVTDAEPPYNNLFDKHEHYEYECDTSG